MHRDAGRGRMADGDQPDLESDIYERMYRRLASACLPACLPTSSYPILSHSSHPVLSVDESDTRNTKMVTDSLTRLGAPNPRSPRVRTEEGLLDLCGINVTRTTIAQTNLQHAFIRTAEAEAEPAQAGVPAQAALDDARCARLEWADGDRDRRELGAGEGVVSADAACPSQILLSKNARVYMAARSQSKADAAIAELKKDTGKEDIFFLQLDLADLKSVRDAANTFIEKEPKLHVLFNNGGVMFLPLDQMTAQGYDSQFGTNVLGHYFFTTLLLPLLISTAQADPKHKARIVHNSSDGAELFKVPGGIDWDSLKKGDASKKVRAKLGTKKLYGQSKLGNILLSNELARRRTCSGTRGAVLKTFLETVVLKDISLGVISQLYAGTADDALAMNGEYLVPWARRTFPDKDAQSPELAKKMWEWCEEQTKGF
ncbi:hypothetical protein EVG20_g10283 [Dentipellis fragilis]|uniref:NAD(P)-binding protein n=1 Tax=Dentipellis fragilis TaxID=205917 RepID=A0A4Y9XRX4_9AGAM|nr:hypothetical protein EVG20_g10283 [Dentipellis fragilis]